LNRKTEFDIFLGIEWDIEQEAEVAAWFEGLDRPQFGHVAFHVDRLLAIGSRLRMPHSRALGDGLYELRFDLGPVSWRITYFFTKPRRIVLLTVFRKQRNNERHEVNRAHAAMARCITEGHTADED
jgi:hypothetical protein